MSHRSHAPGKPKCTARVYKFTSPEVKMALHAAILQRTECTRTPAGYLNAEIDYCKETDRIIGARVWYTKNLPEVDDPTFAVKV